MADDEYALAAQLAEVARELMDAGDLPATLQRMVELAVETIEGCDHAGISLTVGAETSTSAQSDDVPGRIDLIPTDGDDGSYRDAVREHDLFSSGDLAREERWQRFFAEVVASTPVRSLLAMRLFVEGDTLGTLNLYAGSVDAFDDEDREVAAIFAAHAAIALQTAQREEQLAEEVDGDDVDVVARAKGLVMGERGVDEQTAQDALEGAADRTDRTVREVAEDTVTGDH